MLDTDLELADEELAKIKPVSPDTLIQQAVGFELADSILKRNTG